MNVNMIAKN